MLVIAAIKSFHLLTIAMNFMSQKHTVERRMVESSSDVIPFVFNLRSRSCITSPLLASSLSWQLYPIHLGSAL